MAERTEQACKAIIEQARKDGAEAGKGAGGWLIDGNTSTERCRWWVKGIEDGDPLVMDALPSSPLSGEFAGGVLVGDLARTHGIDEEAEAEFLDEVCDAYQGAYESAAHDEVERAARYQLEG